jgi:hypothetical protein
MLAQLPRHTIAKKVENYEHLDLLWGKDVDKVVIPHVLGYLKVYAESVEGFKSPVYSDTRVIVPHQINAESELCVAGLSYSQAATGDYGSEKIGGLSYAEIAAENTIISESHGSDSDETMGDDHGASLIPGIS